MTEAKELIEKKITIDRADFIIAAQNVWPQVPGLRALAGQKIYEDMVVKFIRELFGKEYAPCQKPKT